MGSSSGITFSGLSSGLDTSAIVDALVNASKAPIYRLQRQKSNLNIHKSTYESIEGMIDALETKAQGLDTTKEFFVYSASSSDTTKATVAADGDAVPGRYSMTINTLASAERTYSDSLGTSATTALNISGTLGITVGSGSQVEIELEANDTATTIASRINASGADVTAGLLFDGTNYYVQVSGNSTGADNAITFDETGLTEEETALNFDRVSNQKQAATDSSITIDTFTITRASNTINDVIPGVTLDLEATTSDPIEIELSVDAAGTEAKVQSFVDQYNTIIKKINSEFSYNSDTGADSSRLFGDSTLRNIRHNLTSKFTGGVSGLTGDYTSLRAAGITLQEDGTLALSSSDFKDALVDDSVAVSRLFINDTANSTEGVAKIIDDLAESYTDFVDGLLTIRKNGIDSRVESLDEDIVRLEDRATAYRAQLEAQFMALEQMMTQIQGQGAYLSSQIASLNNNNKK